MFLDSMKIPLIGSIFFRSISKENLFWKLSILTNTSKLSLIIDEGVGVKLSFLMMLIAWDEVNLSDWYNFMMKFLN